MCDSYDEPSITTSVQIEWKFEPSMKATNLILNDHNN